MVFRSLPNLAQQYVMRLLFIEIPILPDDFQKWIDPKSLADHTTSMQRLWDVRVLEESLVVQEEKGVLLNIQAVRMNQAFQQKLRIALTRPQQSSGDVLKESSRDAINTINTYATHKWEAIVSHLLVPTPEPIIIDLFEHMGLLTTSRQITPKGYAFVMQDEYSQAWNFTVAYAETAPRRGLVKHEVLTFLFQLGFHEFGKSYSVEALTQSQQVMLNDLSLFGLVYRKKPNSRNFFSTRLAIQLSSGHTGLQDAGFIILETNFKLYAYTTSALQIQRLELFCEILFLLPNLVVASIVRSSCLAAVEKGISAKQILKFLETNAHPSTLHRDPVIPDGVSEQIYLWEQDLERVNFHNVRVIEGFATLAQFEEVCRHATSLSALEWSKPQTKTLLILEEFYIQIREFIRSRKM